MSAWLRHLPMEIDCTTESWISTVQFGSRTTQEYPGPHPVICFTYVRVYSVQNCSVLWRFFNRNGIATLLNSNSHYLMKSSANHEFLSSLPPTLLYNGLICWPETFRLKSFWSFKWSSYLEGKPFPLSSFSVKLGCYWSSMRSNAISFSFTFFFIEYT